jgi:hypothetical protein
MPGDAIKGAEEVDLIRVAHGLRPETMFRPLGVIVRKGQGNDGGEHVLDERYAVKVCVFDGLVLKGHECTEVVRVS